MINYQDLNHFLANDKFPLPNKSALFQHLSSAKIFPKFDLKAGFWQLGIHPEERYKTAFCIPDHHYQWTVMPFGLNNAPSQFQKLHYHCTFKEILAVKQYVLQPHIAASLGQFPDRLTSAKQIQQFLGTNVHIGVIPGST